MLGPRARDSRVRERWRLLGRLPVLAVVPAMLFSAPSPSAAFEIFGMKFFESEEDEPPVVDPLSYTVTFDTGGSDDALAAELRDASTLLADQERPVSGSVGLLAKVRTERELLVATLYESARYEGVVDITVAGRPIDDIPPDAQFSDAAAVPVSVRVTPGRAFTLGDVVLAGDAADLAPARFGLIAGGDAGSTRILQAERDIVRALREEGRPLAAVTGREVVADSATGQLDVTLTVAAGPVAGYGDTTVTGTEKVDNEFTRYMAGLEPGGTYSPEEIEEARDRLLALEVFDSVTVQPADALEAGGAIPIAVEVSERKHRYFGVGATYSNTEGAGLEGYWGHRNLFGRAEKLRIEGSISRLGDTARFGKLNYNAAALFEKPGVIGPASKFTANLKTAYEHPEAYDRFSFKGGAGITYELTRKQTVSGEVALDYSKIDDSFGSKRFLIASIPLQYVYDNRNDRLNPTRGFRLLAYVEPSHDILSGATFVKLRGEASAYQALDDARRFVLAGRVAAGSIVGAGLASIPADRRFYSGGGGSVRGYAYQGIGPVDATGKPTGGRSFAEASLELRMGITENFGIVPFVDAGTVSTGPTPDFADVRLGAGLGIRYLTPFGPLRVDVGVPLDRQPGDPSFGIYAGIGQAF